MAYTVLADALTRAKERSGATSTDDAYLTELLSLSAGTDPDNVTHYRPFYCAAKWLEQDSGTQALSEAKGVKFTGKVRPIASLLALQLSYDTANQLTIPEGFEAVQTQTAPRLSTRSHSPTLRP